MHPEFAQIGSQGESNWLTSANAVIRAGMEGLRQRGYTAQTAMRQSAPLEPTASQHPVTPKSSASSDAAAPGHAGEPTPQQKQFPSTGKLDSCGRSVSPARCYLDSGPPWAGLECRSCRKMVDKKDWLTEQ